MEVEKADNENKSNNSDLLATDPCNKDDKENGKTSVQSKSETSKTTSSFQNYANPDKITNNTEGFVVGMNEEQGKINLESETDKNSVKKEEGDSSFVCIDHKDCQDTKNENQAENPTIQSANHTGLGNAGGQTSDSLFPGNSYQSVYGYKQQPFDSRHITSIERQLQNSRQGSDRSNSLKTHNYRQSGNLTAAYGRGQSITRQQEQEGKNTKPRHGANFSSTSSTDSSEKSKTSGNPKFDEEDTACNDTLLAAASTSKVDGAGQNLSGLSDPNQSHHSCVNTDEGHQKDDSKSTVSSASATTDRKNSLDDSKENSVEADKNSEDMFGSERAPVRQHKIEQAINSSLVITYAGTNQQKKNTAHPEKISTEEETTTPEAKALKVTQKGITNKNALMQEYNEEQDKAGYSLDENKKRVADKEEVHENKNTANMDVRYKYKNKKNGNSSQSDTSLEDQNLKKDSSSEFKGKINLQIPHVDNPDNNTVNSGECYQYGPTYIIHSPGSEHLNDRNKSTQTEENLNEECQKCMEKNLNISNLETRIEYLTDETLKKDKRIKQLEQENLKKDENIKELHNKTSEMEETNKNFKQSDEECKSAIESLLKYLSIKKSSESSGLWNFLTGNKNKADKDGTINAINQIKSHIQKLEAKVTGGQKEIEEKVILVNTYVEELRIRNIEYKNLEKTFEKKGKDQVKILQGRDTEIKELIKERGMKEKYYTEKFIKLSEENNDLKTRLKECNKDFNDALKNLKEKDKILAEFNSAFKSQVSIITKLQNENKILEQERTSLEKSLQQISAKLQMVKNKNSTLMLQLDQACKKIKKFEEELNILRNTVKKEEADLKPQKEAMQIYLNRISNTIQIVCEPVSQEENAKQTDKTFINNALERIHKIQQDVNSYEDEIRKFEGNRQSKTYLHLKEMLLRAAVQLDGVESERKQKILTSRKDAIARVKNLLEKLDEKVQY